MATTSTMRQVDLAEPRRCGSGRTSGTTDARTLRPRLEASGDRSRIGIVGWDTVSAYAAATDGFSAERTFTSSGFLALDATGSRMLLGRGTFAVSTGNQILRATIPEGGHALAVDAAGAVGYRLQETYVEVLDIGRGLVVGSIPLPEAVRLYEDVSMALSGDGRTLAVLTVSGVSLLRVATATPLGCPTPAAPASVIAFCGAPLADVVVDGSGRAYASNPARNQVEVVSLATGAVEAPILVDPNHGASISAPTAPGSTWPTPAARTSRSSISPWARRCPGSRCPPMGSP